MTDPFVDTTKLDDLADKVADRVHSKGHPCVFEPGTITTLNSFARFWDELTCFARKSAVRALVAGVVMLILLGVVLLYSATHRG